MNEFVQISRKTRHSKSKSKLVKNAVHDFNSSKRCNFYYELYLSILSCHSSFLIKVQFVAIEEAAPGDSA